VVGVLVLLLLGVGWFAYSRATDEQRICAQAERMLRRLTGGDVHIGEASFSLFDGLHLQRMTVAVPMAHGEETLPEGETLFTAGDVYLKLDPFSLLAGRLRVPEIVATDTVVNLVTDETTGDANWKRLRSEPRPQTGSVHRPEVRLRRARVRVSGVLDGERRLHGEIPLDVRATPAQDRPGVYEVAWRTRTVDRESGRLILDQKRLTVHTKSGGLPTFTIDAAAAAVAVPPELQRRLDELGLTGNIRPTHVALDRENRNAVRLDLSSAALSIPLDVEEAKAAPEDRFVRLSDVHGVIEFSGDALRAELEGALDLPSAQPPSADTPPTRFRLEGQLLGDFRSARDIADLGFEVTASITGLRLPNAGPDGSPAERRFVERWWRVKRFFELYDPHGIVDVSAQFERPPGRESDVKLGEAIITSRGADASYAKFPYRVSGLTGSVVFGPDGIQLRELYGDHDGGWVRVNGWVAEFGRYSAVRLDIGGASIAFDEELRSALKPRFQEIWDRFNVTGRADVHVRLSRDQGSEEEGHKPWSPDIDVDFRNASARYEKFDYPLEALTGRLEITGEKMVLTDVRARRGSSFVRLDGEGIHRGPQAGTTNLEIAAEDLPIDDVLINALPADAREGLAELDLTGLADVRGRLYRHAGETLAYDLTAQIHDAAVRPEVFPYPLENLTARVHLTPGHIEIEELTSWHEGSQVTATGSIERGDRGNRLRLNVRSDALALTDDVRTALPLHLQEVWDSLKPRGRVKLEMEIDDDRTLEPPIRSTRTVIEALGNRVRYAAFPLPLQEVRGRITIAGGTVELAGVTARHETAHLAFDGTITREGSARVGTLRVSVKDMPFSESLRQAVPWRIRRAWNGIRPAGTFDLDLSELSFRTPDDGRTEWTFTGTAGVHKAHFDFGFVAEDVEGTLTGTGRARGPGEGIIIDAGMNLARGTIDGRVFRQITGRLNRPEGDDVLHVENLEGRLYGGHCTGMAEVDFGGPTTRYGLSAVVRDAALGDFLNAKRKPDQPPVAATGRISGNVYLSGTTGDRRTRRGKGEIHVTEAQLYKLPFLLSILNVINFTVPDENAFHDAVFKFHIDGAYVVFDDLLLRGNAMSMIGRGSTHTPTETLDLTLVVGSPHDLPRVPVLTEVIEGTARELMEVHVKGSVAKPEITAQPLRSVDAALRTLFGASQRRSANHPPGRK